MHIRCEYISIIFRKLVSFWSFFTIWRNCSCSEFKYLTWQVFHNLLAHKFWLSISSKCLLQIHWFLVKDTFMRPTFFFWEGERWEGAEFLLTNRKSEIRVPLRWKHLQDFSYIILASWNWFSVNRIPGGFQKAVISSKLISKYPWVKTGCNT